MMPTDRDSFKLWCLRRLGFPVVQINADRDQIEDRIDEALDYWRQFNFDAVQTYYLQHQITQQDIDNGYIDVSSNEIQGITRIFPINSDLFSTNMFSFNYQFALNDLPALTGGTMQYYEGVMEYLKTIEMMIMGEKPIRFSRHTGRLYFEMTDPLIKVGSYIVAECFQFLDETQYPSIWSDRMLLRYATALIKLQWANNSKKYNGIQLPGGITVNGQQMYDEATQELDNLQKEFEDTYQEPPMMMIA